MSARMEAGAVAAKAVTAHFHEDVTPGHSVDPTNCWQCLSAAHVAVTALGDAGLLA